MVYRGRCPQNRHDSLPFPNNIFLEWRNLFSFLASSSSPIPSFFARYPVAFEKKGIFQYAPHPSPSSLLYFVCRLHQVPFLFPNAMFQLRIYWIFPDMWPSRNLGHYGECPAFPSFWFENVYLCSYAIRLLLFPPSFFSFSFYFPYLVFFTLNLNTE